VDKLRHVIDAQRDVVGSSRKLAAEALVWINKIIADAGAIRELEGASQSVATPPADAKPREEN
jgi:hypothetical protein